MRKLFHLSSAIVMFIALSCSPKALGNGALADTQKLSDSDRALAEMRKACEGDKLREEFLADYDSITSANNNKRNTLQILVNYNKQIAVLMAGEFRKIDSTEIKSIVKSFLLNAEGNARLPEYETVELPILGKRSVITRKNHVSILIAGGRFMLIPIDSFANEHPYYIEQLFAAYNEVRNEFALKEFGKSFDKCNDEQKDVCRIAFPCLLYEKKLFPNEPIKFIVPPPPSAKIVTDLLEIVEDKSENKKTK